MRPVNLIPEEQRRAGDGTSRTGPLAYIVVGALFALLAGVVMLVLTSNQISDRKDEVATLQIRKAAASKRAERLAPYANFKLVADQRTQTIYSLADSRFDWARVIRQLSLIMPPRIWLESLTGAAGGSSAEGTVASVAGPSMTLKGCAPGQDTVAALVASLKAIDGVTRVGLESSNLADEESKKGKEGKCTDATFALVVAFDAAPASPDGAQAVEAPAPEEPSSTESEASPSGEASASASPQTVPAG